MIETCRQYKTGCSLVVPNARLVEIVDNGHVYSIPANCGLCASRRVVCGFYAAPPIEKPSRAITAPRAPEYVPVVPEYERGIEP